MSGKTNVYVGNLPPDVIEEDLLEIFAPYSIISVALFQHKERQLAAS
jgi:RNA recognition motif-containing protein